MENFWDNVLASSVALAILLLIMAAIYLVWQYFTVKKKRTYFAKLHQELAPGEEVIFGGGIYGVVKEVNGDRVAVKVRSGAVLDVSRYSVQSIESHDARPNDVAEKDSK